MKFRDFLLKHLLADTDYLVGYDANGEYIRISKQDLISTLSSAVTAQTVVQQFSSNGSSWHSTYTNGDSYMRVKTGANSWTPSIKLTVSAYDIWLEQGGEGTEEDFLDSLKGDSGEDADLSDVTIQDIEGYSTFLQNVNASIANAKNAIINEVAELATESVMTQFTEMQLSDIPEIKNITEQDYITIVTSDGLKKVSLGSLVDNVSVKTVSTSNLEKAVNNQLAMFTLNGLKNGSNVNYSTTEDYVQGTSNVYYNGQRLVLGTDYRENDSRSFTMLTHVPVANDSIVFIAVKK